MSYTYAQRKRTQEKAEPAAERAVAPGPDLNALAAGTARPSAAQKGRPIELGAAIKAKMENAFGDLSAVKLYESPTVGAAGAEAMAQGSEIAFAPGMADFSTTEGQARLGHELSHVAARRSGAVSQSSGFLNDRALEARADREGAIAAAGQQVYTGPVTGALSSAAPSPAAAGPMQAKRGSPERKPLEPELIGDKPHWGDVKWGWFDNLKHKLRHRKSLGLSSKKEDVIQREATDMAMTDEKAFNDSVYIPNPEEDEGPEAGYNLVNDPIMPIEEEESYDDYLDAVASMFEMNEKGPSNDDLLNKSMIVRPRKNKKKKKNKK